jgi:hypothetical protein
MENQILPNGTRVITTEPGDSKDWSDPNRPDAKWKVIGRIVGHSDSHGLVYKIKHECFLGGKPVDGEGWYEPGEFNLLSEPCKVDRSTARLTCKLGDVKKAIEQEKELDALLSKVKYED